MFKRIGGDGDDVSDERELFQDRPRHLGEIEMLQMRGNDVHPTPR
jgi:hypothetical protein